ncbi:MAG: ribonuclease P protein component 1 [Candidatus Syntropharchaeia archaeon]
MKPEYLIYHELIGLEVEVCESSNKSMIGIRGRVVDETQNLLILEGGKKIPKSHSTFLFILPDGKKVRVEGKSILSRPEDRTKRLLKRKCIT